LQIFLEAMGGKSDRPNPVSSFPMGIYEHLAKQ